MDPLNYNVNPQGSIQQGFANVLQPMMLAQQMQQAQAAQQQAEKQSQIVNDLTEKQKAGTVTGKDYEQATIAIPGMREQFKQAWDMHSDEEKKSSLSEMTQVYSALSSDRPDLAKQVLTERVTALKNSGAPENRIHAVQTMINNIDVSPDFVRLNTGMMLGAIGAKEAFAGTEEKRKAEMQPEEIKKIASDIGLTEAQTQKALVDEKYLSQKHAADIGLTRAQTNEVNIKTKNLGIEGQIKALEFQGILSGKPVGGKPPTEDEKKSAGYALRLQNNLSLINGIVKKNPSAEQPGMIRTAVGNMIPFGSDGIKKVLASTDRQRIEAAQLDMLDAALTLNTGAAYTKEQLHSLKESYFPGATDDKETIQDKNNRLQSLIDTAMLRAGVAEPLAKKGMEKFRATALEQPTSKAELIPGQTSSAQAAPMAPAALPSGWKVTLKK